MTIVSSTDAESGDRGEQLLAGTDRLRVRVWEHEPSGEQAPAHTNDYDYVAYVTSGRMRVRIGDGDPAEVGEGDSYAVPAGTEYEFEVLEDAKVVEALTL